MSRPKLKRKIEYFPENYKFKPENETEGEKAGVIISLEELESMRLSDLAGLEQTDAAKKMGVSRGTYQRILNTARKKAAEALVFGKEIVISGGQYSLNECKARCASCGALWSSPCNVIFYENSGRCPECGSEEISCIGKDEDCALGEKRHQKMLNPDTRKDFHI